MAKKKKKDKKPQVHKDLEGFNITINELGQIQTNIDTQKMNAFLNKHVADKKLKDRDDLKKDRIAEKNIFEETEEADLPNFYELDKTLEKEQKEEDE